MHETGDWKLDAGKPSVESTVDCEYLHIYIHRAQKERARAGCASDEVGNI